MLTKENFNAECVALAEQAKVYAHHFLEVHVELKEMAEAKDFKSIEYWLEENLSKRSKKEVVLQVYFGNEELNSPLKSLCESKGIDYDFMSHAMSDLIMHRCMTIDAFFNVGASYMRKDPTKKIDDLHAQVRAMEEAQILNRNGEGKLFFPPKNWAIQKDFEDYLDCFASNLPMVVKPQKVRLTKKGYLTSPYLSLRQSAFTKRSPKHSEVPLKFLNDQNAIAYMINYEAWDRFIKFNPQLPEWVTAEDDPEKADDEASYAKKLKAASRQHYSKAFLVELLRLLGIQKVWIPTVFDKRGRNYPIAYLINPQGTDLDKGLLSFEPKPVSEIGIYWLKISIANNFNCKYLGKDLDKHKFEVRYQWYKEFIEPKLQLDSIGFYSWLDQEAKKADSPACFWSQMDNLYNIQIALKRGEQPECWSITHWDATASGYQLQAIFAKDWTMAVLANVINGKEINRWDLYTEIYDQLRLRGIPVKYTRQQIKEGCLVPAVYNSTRSIKRTFSNEEERKIFYKFMNQFFMWRMNRMFPSLWNPEWLDYDYYLPDGFHVQVDVETVFDYMTSYDGIEFPIHIKGKAPVLYSKELGPNITHSCDGMVARELSGRMSWKPSWKLWINRLISNQSLWTHEETPQRQKMKELVELSQRFNFWSIQILKELDVSNVDLVPTEILWELYWELSESPCQVSEIHDSFGVHPDHVEDLMTQYRYVLYRIAKSNYLSEVIYDLTGEYLWQERKDYAFAEEILKSVYALC